MTDTFTKYVNISKISDEFVVISLFSTLVRHCEKDPKIIVKIVKQLRETLSIL